jgi:ATP-dependent DNA helicase RecG
MISQDELTRMFQESGKFYADETVFNSGKLPNNLTVEKIKNGVSVRRNPTLASFAFDLIPYRGIVSGFIRALQHYPHIEFINDTEVEQFKVIIKRP